jgi:DNA polymerase bacteriophage-type
VFKHFLFCDFETYYDTDYSLRKLSAPEYILHPLFEAQLLAAYDVTWPAPRIVLPEEIPDFLAQYPPEQTICVSHNALFDSAILSWRYGWVPGRLGDTLGMARALRSYPRYSLGAVAKELFGHDSKGDVVHKVRGMRAQDIKNAGLWPAYRTYAMQDVRLCAQIYFKLAPEFPPEEIKVMDLVLRAAVQPVLHANVPLLQTHLDELRRKKARLLNDCGFDKAALMSTAQFQQALESLGVEIKTKMSPAGREVPQFAKSDPFMEELLEYAGSENDDVNYQVQTLAAARLSFKSTIEETRAERFVNIAKLPWSRTNGTPVPLLPVALRYGAAHTHRLGGEWKLNMQNLPRDKTKSKLRAALTAPPGCKLITADLSQIEARIVAVLAHQDGLVDAFRKGEDVYAQFASVVFHRPINKRDDPNERFIGKVGILSLGYGAGVVRFNQMVTQQARQYGIPLEGLFDLQIAERTVNTYRSLFDRIPATWRRLDHYLSRNINGGNENPADWGPVKFSAGKITLPNTMTLRYLPNDQHLYGAKLLENISQALARIVIMQAGNRLAKQGLRWVLQAHDELVFVVPEADVNSAKDIILDEMVRPPLWLPELPLAAEIGVGDNYGACK